MSETNGENLPAGWSKTTFGVMTVSDVSQNGPGDCWEFTYIDIGSIDNVAKHIATPKSLPFTEAPSRARQNLKAGDVLVSMTRPNLNAVALVSPEYDGAVGSTGFHVLRTKCVSPSWLFYAVQNSAFIDHMCQLVQGALYPAIRPKDICSSVLMLPPRREQDRITEALDELLSDLDAGVAALERVRAKLSLYRAAVLKAAVEGALTAEWRYRNPTTEPASELLKRILIERRRRWEEEQLRKFKDAGKEPPKNWKAKYKEPVAPATTGLPVLPKGWCWTTAAHLAWTSGYGTSQKCHDTHEGLPVLRIPNIIGGRLDFDRLKYAPQEYFEAEYDFVHQGDLLVVRTNGSRTLIGRGAVVHEPTVFPLSFASYLIRLRLVMLPPLLKWMSVLWDSSQVRGWIETRAATSAGQFNISLSVLDTLPIPLPPSSEQEIIVEIVEDQLSIIEHLEADLAAKLKASKALRQSILRDAFSGKLVPQDPRDEPASELLKRIASEREERDRLAREAKKPSKMPGTPRKRRSGE